MFSLPLRLLFALYVTLAPRYANAAAMYVGQKKGVNENFTPTARKHNDP